jgi:exodeoxyribonuclease-3
MKLTTWNVNGIRSAMDKGFRDYVLKGDADVICLQETKATAEQVDLAWLAGYHPIWNSAVKKGYSGTLVLSRQPVLSHSLGLGIAEHDTEGRVVTAEFPDFHLVNVYTPNSQAGLVRLPYRLKWDQAFLAHVKKLERTKPVLVCGDLNCAHKEIDIANPKTNRKNPGFTDEERASFDNYIAADVIDVFREFDKSAGRYTWWTMRTGGSAREKNIGWRLDYWLASRSFLDRVGGCTIRADIYGSDHCPVELSL